MDLCEGCWRKFAIWSWLLDCLSCFEFCDFCDTIFGGTGEKPIATMQEQVVTVVDTENFLQR